MRHISIADDFSMTPGGRFNRDGPNSGEAFRRRFLEPALLDGAEGVLIDLDRVAGLPSSFLEEAFGGIFRARRGLRLADVKQRIIVQTQERDLQPYVRLIEKYMEEAARAPLPA